MKNFFFSITCLVIIAVILISCGQQSKTADSRAKNDPKAVKTDAKTKPAGPLLTAYLGLKNALIADDATAVSEAGNQLLKALGKIDHSAIPGGKLNDYKDIVDDIKENATHIATNADQIAHQREHFESLSNDVNDMINLLGAPQKLYVDRCPMYNEGKGAIWISETKAIKNPYYGKQMLTCGAVKQEY
ncbi:DUF3347 domain-containing protein [Pedobacter sp. HDW13]|uniref:DUF3347 domain-containing protein n=1 Tax=Pedobacter sp. HDW13 TaxID=2714940 RepID=UPI0014075B7B|nr:DUF3347 domain-containing protein [Pedobacter sp. HDW13]QIL41829.1 DUF3347 domain-containing protein [Pedobacter sp. HDW13]